MDSKSDVVIIGGGVIGVSTAYYLRKNGIRAAIIEKGEIGDACSKKNAGFISPSHFIPLSAPGIISKGLKWMLNPESPFYIKPRLDAQLISWLWKFRSSANEKVARKAFPVLRDLNCESLALYKELAKELQFEFRTNGLLMLARSEAGFAEIAREAGLAKDLGLTAKVLSRDEVNELQPGLQSAALGGVHFEDDAHLNPEQLVQSMRRYLEAEGIAFHTGTEVRDFVLSNGIVKSVKTSKGEIAADQFVMAGGSWSPLLLAKLGIGIPLQPGKGYSVTIDHPDRTLSIPLILSEARVAITPLEIGMRFGGTMELAGYDFSINMRRVNAILKSVAKYLSGFDPSKVDTSHAWAGLRPCTPDGMPFIGRFAAKDNLIAATGHAMLGISLAPITGKLVADIVCGQSPSINLVPLRPDRFKPR